MGGLGSVGIAYTLQTVAQRDAIPSHSALTSKDKLKNTSDLSLFLLLFNS